MRTRALAMLFFIAGLLVGCGKAGHERPVATHSDLPAVEVRTRIVEAKTTPAIEEVVGTVRARLRATLEAKTSGRILELPVVLGQRVSTDDLLARLDAPEIKARVEQAEANVQQAEREWKRISSLHQQQAATQADYDAAESRRQLAQAALAEARALLNYIEIKAPFDGVVTRKLADKGDLAAPGKPLMELEDPTHLQLEAEVPEAIAGRIKAGDRLSVRAGQGSDECTASVAEISPNADPLSRTLRVKLDLPSDVSALRPGQFARLAVPVGEVNSMRVPASAVLQRGQLEIVFAIENQRARLHLVKTGRQLKDETEILSGLDPGDEVVLENAAQLMDGQAITVVK